MVPWKHSHLAAAVIAVAATIAAGVAARAIESVVQAVSQRRTAAVVAGAGRPASDLTFHFAADVAGAGHGFLVGDAHADGALDFARDLAGFAHGVLLFPLGRLAFVRAHLDLLFLPHGFANRDFALHFFLDADPLANLDLAAFILRAEHPHVAGARAAGAAGVFAGIVAAVAMTAEQAARFTAFPVTQGFQPFPRDGFFDVLPGLLADFAFFANGGLVADLANFFLDDGDALDAFDDAFFLHLNGLTAEAVHRFLLALDFVHRALDGVLLGDALGDLDVRVVVGQGLLRGAQQRWLAQAGETAKAVMAPRSRAIRTGWRTMPSP